MDEIKVEVTRIGWIGKQRYMGQGWCRGNYKVHFGTRIGVTSALSEWLARQ